MKLMLCICEELRRLLYVTHVNLRNYHVQIAEIGIINERCALFNGHPYNEVI